MKILCFILCIMCEHMSSITLRYSDKFLAQNCQCSRCTSPILIRFLQKKKCLKHSKNISNSDLKTTVDTTLSYLDQESFKIIS